MENQRIRLSKALLKDALFDLLAERSIEKITVYAICDRAQINRTTFYKYYASPYDLLGEAETDFFTELEELLLSEDPLGIEGLSRALTLLDTRREKCRILINALPDRNFSEKLFRLPTIRALISSRTPDCYSPGQKDYIRLFFCQGGYAIIRKWLNREDHESPEEIAGLLAKLGDAILAVDK